MILAPFINKFEVTADVGNSSSSVPSDYHDPNFSHIMVALGGKTFCHGLYRILRCDQVREAKLAMEGVFPELAARIVPFGYDWLGRHFAVDLGRIKDGLPQVLMLEVGAGEAMQIPSSMEDFHNTELVNHADDALSVPFWNRWRKENTKPVAYSECVGYKVPLFLGGADNLSNLEIIDMSVYVHICGQLRTKTLSLLPGQTIRRISMTSP
jgi:hypothetical protein